MSDNNWKKITSLQRKIAFPRSLKQYLFYNFFFVLKYKLYLLN